MRADPYLISPDLLVAINENSFPLELLFRHLLITGQPGSGKSRCVLMPLLRSIMQVTGNNVDRKAAFVVFDPKNELTPYMQLLAEEIGRLDDLIMLRPGKAYYNPLSNPFLTEAEMVEKIVLYASNTNRGGGRGENEAFWANAQRSLLSAVVAVCRAQYSELTYHVLNEVFDKINRFPSSSSAVDWLDDASIPPVAKQGITEFLRLPGETTRPCVATSVSNMLYAWKAEPLRCLTTPREGVPEIDPFEIVDEGKILIISCATAAYGSSITPLMLALKEHMFTAILSRDQVEVEGDEGLRPINQERPIFVVGDEFQTYLSANSNAGELIALDRMRSAKAGYLAATQNLASIHSVMDNHAHATRLISLFSNQVHLSNTCPYTSNHIATLMGTKTKKVVQYSQETRMAPPLLVGREAYRKRNAKNRSGIVIPQQVPKVDAATLARMQTGEYWLRLANGKVAKGSGKPVI
jgi:type IV secretory pathway TraG/TraD family ATPase VirD4